MFSVNLSNLRDVATIDDEVRLKLLFNNIIVSKVGSLNTYYVDVC